MVRPLKMISRHMKSIFIVIPHIGGVVWRKRESQPISLCLECTFGIKDGKRDKSDLTGKSEKFAQVFHHSHGPFPRVFGFEYEV